MHAVLHAERPLSQGKALVGVVNSLGLRRDVKAVDALVKLSGDTTSVAAAPAAQC